MYHGAEHSRFGHSLGVLETATRVLDAVKRNRPDLLGLREDWERYEQVLRLAALLHDVGHAPFSHGTEDLFPSRASGTPFKHEDYTAAIILHSE
ncbi:MAG: HD domain-containing protein [bacterium]